MAYQLQEINRRIKTDVTEFLEECDQAYAQRVSLAADRILSNLDKSPVVLLSGPSGSGKTTTAMKIAEELQRRGVNTHAVAMDNYFKSLNRKTAPRRRSRRARLGRRARSRRRRNRRSRSRPRRRRIRGRARGFRRRRAAPGNVCREDRFRRCALQRRCGHLRRHHRHPRDGRFRPLCRIHPCERSF